MAGSAYDDPDVLNALGAYHAKVTGEGGGGSGADDPEVLRSLASAHTKRGEASAAKTAGQDMSVLRPLRLTEQAVNAGLATIPNAAITATNLFGQPVAWGLSKMSQALGGPEMPAPNIPLINPMMPDVTPREGTWEPWYSGAVSGGASALQGGLAARAVGAGGKIIGDGAKAAAGLLAGGKGEMGRLGAEVLHSGVVPGTAGAGAMDFLSQAGAPEWMKTLGGAAAGFASGLLSHHYLGKDPVEAVTSNLGAAKDADEVGNIAKATVRDWQQGFSQKIEALKRVSDQPLSSDAPDVYVPKMFGKVPVEYATTDGAETLARVRELASKGGIFKSWFQKFHSALPSAMQAELEDVAGKNNPIQLVTKGPGPRGPKSTGPVPEPDPQMVRPGPAPPYEPTTPLRSDSFQAVEPVNPGGPVGFHVEEPSAPDWQAGKGHIIGFKAPLQDMLDFRSSIGKMVGAANTETEREITQSMYEAICRDIEKPMRQFGAAEDWNHYNLESTKTHWAQGILEKIAGEGNALQDPIVGGKAVERVWNNMKTDSAEISILRQEVPKAADEIASAYLRKHGPRGFQLPPGEKGGLPDATKEALVPNPWERMILERSSSTKHGPAWQNAITSSGGAFLGETIGNAINSQLGTPENPLFNPSVLATVGALSVPGLRVLRGAKENLSSMRVPLQGALSGASASPLISQKKPTE